MAASAGPSLCISFRGRLPLAVPERVAQMGLCLLAARRRRQRPERASLPKAAAGATDGEIEHHFAVGVRKADGHAVIGQPHFCHPSSRVWRRTPPTSRCESPLPRLKRESKGSAPSRHAKSLAFGSKSCGFAFERHWHGVLPTRRRRARRLAWGASVHAVTATGARARSIARLQAPRKPEACKPGRRIRGFHRRRGQRHVRGTAAKLRFGADKAEGHGTRTRHLRPGHGPARAAPSLSRAVARRAKAEPQKWAQCSFGELTLKKPSTGCRRATDKRQRKSGNCTSNCNCCCLREESSGRWRNHGGWNSPARTPAKVVVAVRGENS